MGERTAYAHGIPSWVDLGTDDIAGATAFYGALFGWNAADVPTGDQAGSYTMFTKNGKNVAGMGELPADSDTPPVWSTYIAVEDVDVAVDKAVNAGGAVIMPAVDVMGTGRMAFISDPTGAAVGLWQAGSHIGAELVNEHGTFTWSELLTDDPGRAAGFYQDVFGYRIETHDTPNGPYTMLWAEGNIEGHAAAGVLRRTPGMGEFPNYWSVYFSVDDCDAAVKAAVAIGAAALAGPMNVPGVGRLAVIEDPQGAVFSVMTYENPIS